MPRTLIADSVSLDVFVADNDTTTPDFTVPAKHIMEATVPSSVGEFKDQAEFTLDNEGGRYRSGSTRINVGDRVEFSAAFGPVGNVGETAPDPLPTPQRRFTGVVGNPAMTLSHGTDTLSFPAENFVGWTLASRVVEAGFEDRQVAGPSDAILNFILRREAPEIDRSQIQAINVNTSITFNATQLTDAVRRLLARGDVVMTTDGRALITEPLTDVVSEFTLSGTDYSLPITFDTNTDGFANDVRVDGGKATASDSSAGAVVDFSTVTKTTREIIQLSMPKSEVSEVEIWTDPTVTNSGDGMVARLQIDQGGAPIAPDDDTKDYARRTLADDFLATNDFTTFLFPDHDITERNPWLIIEADGEGDGSGQAVGVDDVGDPVIRSYYPFPVSARVEDTDSIQQYRRREIQLQNDALHTLEEVTEAANDQLKHHNSLSRRLDMEAASVRAHELIPGQAIFVDDMVAGVSADYLLLERVDRYAGGGEEAGHITTDLRFEDIESF